MRGSSAAAAVGMARRLAGRARPPGWLRWYRPGGRRCQGASRFRRPCTLAGELLKARAD